ncbi:MAG: hypothetical protein ACLPKZ_05765 [Acidimicrobiales bacterium]
MRHVRRPAFARVAMISVALGVAGLGLPSTNALAAPTTTTTLPATILTAGNVYARHLLAGQPIPPEAQKVSTLPTPLAPSSDVGYGPLVRHAWALYLLPMSVSVDPYVRAHLPSGEKVDETGSGSSPNAYPTYNLGLSRTCVSPHITYCGVYYSMTEAKDGEQELRVYVAVIYLPIIRAQMPTDGVVTVTGFGQISVMDGSSHPTSVVLTHHQALTLRTVIAELKDFGGGMCMEDSQLLKINIVKDGKSVWSATADECPGVLAITSGTTTLSLYNRSCAFWHVVDSFFSPGTANGTKSGGQVCVDDQDG